MPKTASTTRTVRQNWKLIRDWLRKNEPGLDTQFDKGASATAVRDLAEYLGRTLPPCFAESLCCHTHAAYVIPSPAKHWTDAAYGLMNIEQITDTWVSMNELYDQGCLDHGRVKVSRGVVQQWWCPYWIPFAGNGAGDFYCVDLCPTYPGRIGQVLWCPHDSVVRPKLADSFGQFLETLADNYLWGRYCNDTAGIGHGMIRADVKSFPRSELRG